MRMQHQKSPENALDHQTLPEITRSRVVSPEHEINRSHIGSLTATPDHALESVLSARTHTMRSHINVGTGKEVTIKELAEKIKEVVGFKGKIVFDPTKPDGTPRKLLDVKLLSELGWNANIPLMAGLKLSYIDFKKDLRY